MTQKENIQIGSISVAMMRLFIEGLKEDERLQIAVKSMMMKGDTASLMYALGNSFPMVVRASLTGEREDVLKFNHFMNSLCFMKADLSDKEQVNLLHNDEIMKSINESLNKLSADLNKEITVLTQFEDLKN